jgi:RNA polymerase sigma-70 factor (ECF subfamily)
VPEVAELAIMAYHRFQARLTLRITWANYQPAFLFYDGDRLAVCQVFHISEDGKISQINTIVDPEKLHNIY